MLLMYLDNLLIAKTELDYTGIETITEIMEYQRREAIEMYDKSITHFFIESKKPVFFIDRVPSKLNYENLHLISWWCIIKQYPSLEFTFEEQFHKFKKNVRSI